MNGGIRIHIPEIGVRPSVAHVFEQFIGALETVPPQGLIEPQPGGQLAAAIEDVLAVQHAIDTGNTISTSSR